MIPNGRRFTTLHPEALRERHYDGFEEPVLLLRTPTDLLLRLLPCLTTKVLGEARGWVGPAKRLVKLCPLRLDLPH